MTTTITISNVRPSTCIDIDNTYDVDFVVMRDDGASVAGEATLGWEQQNNQYAPVGDSLDCWMTGKACAALMGDRDAIESIAAEADLAIKRVVR